MTADVKTREKARIPKKRENVESMRRAMNLGRAILTCGALFGAPACMMTGGSHMAQGQLYASGNPAYDTFFHDVHQQQVEAASWGDDKKGAHRALVSALELTPDAPDVTIVQATHEGASKVAKQPELNQIPQWIGR